MKLTDPPGAPYPSPDAWLRIRDDTCTTMARAYLGGRLDPYGRFTVGYINPLPTGWEQGERTVTCGLQAPSSSAASATATVFRGRVADLDQSLVLSAGTWPAARGWRATSPTTTRWWAGPT